jgi:ribonucleoside-diphosphate reductase alpha chain
VSARLTRNAQTVLERRYLARDEAGRTVESAPDMFRRVARAIADVDRSYDGSAEGARLEERYFEAMDGLLFLPNSPTLMNAGTICPQLAACFVLPVGDSIGEIFGAVREMALVHQSGGGTGFSFSHLRPSGDPVRETGGVASGPVSFMRVFDVATDVVKLGGRRRGANMAVLRADHPDVFAFVAAKDDRTALTNFNLSVAVPDAFMAAVARGDSWKLINPRTGKCVQVVPARALWSEICAAAWRNGDPGLLFIDEINRHNPTPILGAIEATNPCGEQPLLPYEACNLGSLNLARLVMPAGVDWARLEELVALAVQFLDGAVDAGQYPLPEIERMARANRKIGLGVMGFADALIALGIPYASDEAVAFADRLMAFVARAARRASVRLAERRGAFPNCARSVWPGRGVPAIRNAALTTIAPTGTLSIIAGTSSGIEPLFALAFTRTVLDGTVMREVSGPFVAALERLGLPVEPILAEVARTGSARDVAALPADVRLLFQTALDIAPEWHVRVQAAFQRHTDNGVSKTVNLPAAATVDDVGSVYELAWRSGCKGVTVFRDGCRGEQVLQLDRIPALAPTPEGAFAHAEYAGECRLCAV